MTDDDFLAAMRKRRDDAQSAALVHNERAADDLRMLVGDQWPDAVRAAREADGQPCLTINTLPQYVRQVTGQVRNLNPAIRVIAGDTVASKDTAEILEGLIRNIENNCDASSVYEQAAESAAACGIGYWRLRSDYTGADTFDQEIMIERIYNPFSVYTDPMAKHPTRKDAMFGFIIDEMRNDDFKATYPDVAVTDFSSANRPVWFTQWQSEDTVTVAEYFWIEYDEYTLYLLPDGSTSKQKPPFKTKSRAVKQPKVMWAKVTGDAVLEGPTRLPGCCIPIIAVTGEEWHLGEETYRSGVIRYAKDSQSIYNYAASTSTEMIAMQAKAPWLVTTKHIAGNEAMWAGANSANNAVLVYNPDEKAPSPQRIQPPVSSEAMNTLQQIASEDMKRTTGIYDAGLGARSNETSGKAIMARKEESQNATSIYADNMVKGVTQTANLLLEWIPSIYDTHRVVQTLGIDGQEKLVAINDIMMTQDGIQPVNDVTQGKYQVKIAVGPSYQTKRAESLEGMTAFFQAVPQAAAMAGDLYAGAQDWPDADRIAERLRKALPPGMADDPTADLTPEEQQAKMQAQQAAQQQQQEQQAIAKRGAMAEVSTAEANAAKADAEAEKAHYEAKKAELEWQAMTGQLAQHANDAVTLALATHGA